MNRYFLLRPTPPRLSFAFDMKPGEAKRAHRLLERAPDKGTAIAFGPAADPKGPWGLGIVAAESKDAVCELQEQDPAIKAQIGMPMPRLSAGGIAAERRSYSGSEAAPADQGLRFPAGQRRDG